MKTLSVPCTRHQNGYQVVPDGLDAVKAWIGSKPEGWRGTMTLSDEKKLRTRGQKDDEGNQDGFWFGIVIPILMEEVWFTKSKEEAYIRTLEAISYRLERNPRGGEPIKVLVHVSDLDREGMRKLIEDAQMWAAQEHGVFIPDPDPKKSKRWLATFRARGYATPSMEQTI